MTKNASTRVFERDGINFACLYSTNRRVELGVHGSKVDNDPDYFGQRRFTTAGRYIAFEDFQVKTGDVTFQILVVNLRSRVRVQVPGRFAGDFGLGA